MLGDFVVTLVPSLIFAATSMVFVAAYLRWHRRREDPEYAPAWTIFYIYALGAFILAGMGAEYLLGRIATRKPRYTAAHAAPKPQRITRRLRRPVPDPAAVEVSQ